MGRKLLIGVDISMDSTGICFKILDEKAGNKIFYMNILNRWKFTGAKEYSIDGIIKDNDHLEVLFKIPNVKIEIVDRQSVSSPKKVGLDVWERNHLTSITHFGNLVANNILTKIIEFGFEKLDNVYICLENYNYSSSGGDQSIQIIEYGYKIKNTLIEHHKLKLENFYIVPAPKVKMYAGKGDFTKFDMLQSFVKNNNLDLFVESCEFRQILVANTQKFFKVNQNQVAKLVEAKLELDAVKKSELKDTKLLKKKILLAENKCKSIQRKINEVLSPVDDIIDAYFICDYLHKVLLKF